MLRIVCLLQTYPGIRFWGCQSTEYYQKTVQNNLDLKIAISRIQQSDAYFKQSQDGLLPTINGGPTATISKIVRQHRLTHFFPTHHIENFQLGINTGWEIDVWGKTGFC